MIPWHYIVWILFSILISELLFWFGFDKKTRRQEFYGTKIFSLVLGILTGGLGTFSVIILVKAGKVLVIKNLKIVVIIILGIVLFIEINHLISKKLDRRKK